MRFVGFIGPSYTLQSVNVDCQRTVNLYPEIDELGTGNEKEVASLVGVPGKRLLVTLPTGPIRGEFTDSSGKLWVVSGNTLYQIASNWTYTVAGQLNTSVGPVSFDDNGLQMVVVDGPSGYYWDYDKNTFNTIVDESFLGSDQVRFMDSFFIFNQPNSKFAYNSPSNAVIPFDGTNKAAIESTPDNLLGFEVTQENIYFFKGRTIEVYFDNAGAGFPFARVQGAVLSVGCLAAFSIAKIGEAVLWLGQDTNGRGIVYSVEGYQPKRISTFAIETMIQRLGDLSTARAWSYSQSGHSFYCLNLPGASTTWVYDSSTSLWHERAFLSQGQYTRDIADCHAFAYNTNVVGDYSSGKLYALDPTVFTDNGNTIVRERTSPHISNDMVMQFHTGFELDMEAGVGLDGITQGTDPKVMLQWSNDGGHSWSNEHWTSAGKIGQRRKRARWQRLGASRDRVYRVKISDPIKVTILGAEIDLELGTS